MTLLTRPAQADTLTAAIKAKGANIYVDRVAAESADDVAKVLKDRVTIGHRFG